MTWKPVVSAPGTQRFHLLSNGPLQALEVTLRNAAHDKLRHHFGGQWFRSASVLDGDELRMAQDAELKLTFRTSRDRYTPPLQLAPAEV